MSPHLEESSNVAIKRILRPMPWPGYRCLHETPSTLPDRRASTLSVWRSFFRVINTVPHLSSLKTSPLKACLHESICSCKQHHSTKCSDATSSNSCCLQFEERSKPFTSMLLYTNHMQFELLS